MTKGLTKAFMLIMACMALFTACKEDDEVIVASIDLEHTALYITTPATTEQLSFTAHQVVGISLVSIPEGWDFAYDLAASTLSVTSPSAEDLESGAAEESGDITFYIYSPTSNATQVQLYVTMLLPTSLDHLQSNCYVITEAEKSYAIPVNRRGEGSEELAVSSVELIWQSPSTMISYLQMYDKEHCTFYIEADDDDLLTAGNALIGGYDEAGNLLWSWHIWMTPTEPQNIGRYMDRNLGAAYARHSTREEILNSYGTYYQWGRPTPFVGPLEYNCASSASALMYDLLGNSYVYIDYELTTAEKGTIEAAVATPLTYLLSDEQNAYDWNTSHTENLWLADQKTLYDPCPKGWRVADNFDDLTFAGDTSLGLELLSGQFGWEFSDGENELFLLGGGRRSWLTGLITNVNTADTPKPWIGYYWTATTEAEHLSRALYFSLDTENPEASEVDLSLPSPRANAMQVRCIKNE